MVPLFPVGGGFIRPETDGFDKSNPYIIAGSINQTPCTIRISNFLFLLPTLLFS